MQWLFQNGKIQYTKFVNLPPENQSFDKTLAKPNLYQLKANGKGVVGCTWRQNFFTRQNNRRTRIKSSNEEEEFRAAVIGNENTFEAKTIAFKTKDNATTSEKRNIITFIDIHSNFLTRSIGA